MMTLQATVRVMIADDDSDMRLLVRTTLGGDDRLEVIGEAADGPSAVELFRGIRPDACILDYRMPGLSGIEAARAILAEDPDMPILLFSAFLDEEINAAAAELGLHCLRKDLFMALAGEVLAIVGN